MDDAKFFPGMNELCSDKQVGDDVGRAVVSLHHRLGDIVTAFCTELKSLRCEIEDMRGIINNPCCNVAGCVVPLRHTGQLSTQEYLSGLEQKVQHMEKQLVLAEPTVSADITSEGEYYQSVPLTELNSDELVSIADAYDTLALETKATYENQIQMLRRTVTALTEELEQQHERYSGILADRDAQLHAIRALAAMQADEVDACLKNSAEERFQIRDLLNVINDALVTTGRFRNNSKGA